MGTVRSWRRIGVVVLLLFMAALTASAARQYWPAPNRDFYVCDQAGLLSAVDAAAMRVAGESLASREGIQVVAVTVNSLSGHDMETYATTLFRDWGIGDRQKNNGVLLLIAKEERQFRIEVGYGLEGTLTDGWCGEVLDRMRQRFQAGDFSAAIRETYAALAVKAGGGYEAVPSAVRALAGMSGERDSSETAASAPASLLRDKTPEKARREVLPSSFLAQWSPILWQFFAFVGIDNEGYLAQYLHVEFLWLVLRLLLEILCRLFGYHFRLYQLRYLLICLVFECMMNTGFTGGGRFGGFGGGGNSGGGGRSGGGGASGGW